MRKGRGRGGVGECEMGGRVHPVVWASMWVESATGPGLFVQAEGWE